MKSWFLETWFSRRNKGRLEILKANFFLTVFVKITEVQLIYEDSQYINNNILFIVYINNSSH